MYFKNRFYFSFFLVTLSNVQTVDSHKVERPSSTSPASATEKTSRTRSDHAVSARLDECWFTEMDSTHSLTSDMSTLLYI